MYLDQRFRDHSCKTSLTTNHMAAWRSGNIVGRINEVTLRRARLVLGWVTCPGSTPGGGTLCRYVTSHPGRLSLSSFRSDVCFLARAATSGECLRGKGLVWLIGAVVCVVAAALRYCTIDSCQSTATSCDCTARLVAHCRCK